MKEINNVSIISINEIFIEIKMAKSGDIQWKSKWNINEISAAK
jgi:hypothetical protein